MPALMSTTGPVRIAVLGCGFWSRFQAAGWQELGPDAVRVVAVCDPDRARAEAAADRVGGGAVAYTDAGELLTRERVDAVDVITPVGTHADLVRLAAARGVPVICQKPMARTLPEAEQMVAACRQAGVPLLVHENWRWQTPVRALKRAVEGNHAAGGIGRVFRARLDFVTGFPVFRNQPFLADLEQFILTDIGSHVLDAARFLFGEAATVYCQTARAHRHIRGEDVATVVLRTAGGATVTCNMAYAGNHLEHDRFPETFAFVEGEHGSAELGPDYWVRVTTAAGTHAARHPPPRHAWADPAYDVVQASIVPCNADLLAHLRGGRPAETTGEDNLNTVRLVFAAYASAAKDEVVRVGG